MDEDTKSSVVGSYSCSSSEPQRSEICIDDREDSVKYHALNKISKDNNNQESDPSVQQLADAKSSRQTSHFESPASFKFSVNHKQHTPGLSRSKKVAVVTGSSGDIGCACVARMLVSHDTDLVLCLDKRPMDESVLLQIVQEAITCSDQVCHLSEEFHPFAAGKEDFAVNLIRERTIFICADLTDEHDVRENVKKAVGDKTQHIGSIHALITCVGGAVNRTSHDPPNNIPDASSFEAHMELNTKTAVVALRVFMPCLLRAGIGAVCCVSLPVPLDIFTAVDCTAIDLPETSSFPDTSSNGCGSSIVLVSSVNAITGIGQVAYSSAKAALHAIAADIAVRFGKYGVRANAIALGTIATKSAWGTRLLEDPQVAVL